MPMIGLMSAALAVFIKFDGAAQRAMIGHGHRRHTLVFDMIDQLRHFGQSIEQTVLRMIVQVHVITRLKRRFFCCQNYPREP